MRCNAWQSLEGQPFSRLRIKLFEVRQLDVATWMEVVLGNTKILFNLAVRLSAKHYFRTNGTRV